MLYDYGIILAVEGRGCFELLLFWIIVGTTFAVGREFMGNTICCVEFGEREIVLSGILFSCWSIRVSDYEFSLIFGMGKLEILLYIDGLWLFGELIDSETLWE